MGMPRRTGHSDSLGGLIALDLGERFASQYDGIAAICRVAGGSQAQIDRVVNARILFDMFYPGICRGRSTVHRNVG